MHSSSTRPWRASGKRINESNLSWNQAHRAREVIRPMKMPKAASAYVVAVNSDGSIPRTITEMINPITATPRLPTRTVVRDGQPFSLDSRDILVVSMVNCAYDIFIGVPCKKVLRFLNTM